MLPGGNEELARRVPVGRLGKPEEVADFTLAVIRNGYMTNQVFGIDGVGAGGEAPGELVAGILRHGDGVDLDHGHTPI